MNDFRFAWRSLWKSPGFTLVAIIALALGIGANTAMFTIVKAVVLKPLAFHEPDRLVTLWETFLPDGSGTVSNPNLRDWREQQHSFTSISAYSTRSINLQGVSEPERLRAVISTSDLFELLGVPPRFGRAFDKSEDQPGHQAVAVLSASLWKRRFASDPKVIGNTVVLDGEPHTIIGVMPEGFQFPPQNRRPTDVYLPLKMPPELVNARGNHWLFTVARLKPGVTMQSAAADMNSIAERLEKAYPNQQTGRRVKLQPEHDLVSGDIRPVLYVLFAAVGAVLLIACANVANLLLARGAVREREMSVRTALGAGRFRLIRLLLTESLVISLIGGLAGLALAYWGIDLITSVAATNLPRASEVRVDGSVFLYLMGACLFTALIFGLAPALRISRVDLNSGLRDAGSKGTTGGTRQWIRTALVISEIALAFVLLVSTGTLMKTLLKLLEVRPGLDAQNVLTFAVSPAEKKYATKEVATRFYQPVLEQIRAIPGVRAAGAISMLPLEGWGYNGDFGIEGRPPDKPGSEPYAEFRAVTTGYFKALNIPIVEGRDVAESDVDKSQHAVFINQKLARAYFPDQSPIGRRIGDPKSWMVIAGVVGDVRQTGLERPAQSELYVVMQQNEMPVRDMSVVVRAELEPQSLTSAVRAAIRAIDPDQPIFGIKTMERVVADSVSSQRMNFTLMGAFSALAVLLASAGIYGVMSYLVSQRTREFGVRMALGAAATDMMRLILRETAMLVAVAFAVGIAGAYAASRLIQRFIPGVAGADPMVLLGVAAILSIVVGVAVLVPARRAMRVDPMEALRWE